MRWLPEAQDELLALPAREQVALVHVADKLEVMGVALSDPDCSQVRGAQSLRELRPRRGRSRWRAFYRRVGDVWMIGAVGPEAKVNPQGFRAAVAAATRRLAREK